MESLTPIETFLLFLQVLMDIRTELAWLAAAVGCVAGATLVAAWVLYQNGRQSREMAKAINKAKSRNGLREIA